jgi:hypothetical protein
MTDNDDDEKPLGRNENFVSESTKYLDDKEFVLYHLFAVIADALERIADHLEKQKFQEDLK